MYKFYKNDLFEHFNFAIGDIISLQLVFFVPHIMGVVGANNIGSYRIMQLITTLIAMFVAFFTETYKTIYARGYIKEFKSVLFHVSLTFLVLIMTLFLLKNSVVYSRFAVASMWATYIIVEYIVRTLLKKISVRYFKAVKDPRDILLVADEGNVLQVLNRLKQNMFSDFRVVGIVLTDNVNPMKTVSGIPVVCEMNDMCEYITHNVVDEVMFATSADYKKIFGVMDRCITMGIAVHYSLGESEEYKIRRVVEDFGGFSVITSGANLVTSRQLFLKRTMDIFGSIVGLIITGVVTLFVAPAIFLASPGPIFFTQPRVGKNGRIFNIYKFRSMYMDAEERKAALLEQNKMTGLMFKIDNDPRIIKGVGHFIRKFSIDELPQFLNVLVGSMSLVGTRPPTVDEYEQYKYYHKSRLATKPGITGMWQISGRSDITDFDEVVALDNQYIQNWNIGLDIKILFKTILVVLGKKGSV